MPARETYFHLRKRRRLSVWLWCIFLTAFALFGAFVFVRGGELLPVLEAFY